MTTYDEVTAAMPDVAVFLAKNIHAINIWRLPLKAWVARQDGEIVAVLTFTNVVYPALHFILAEPKSRPFMRLLKLWLMAREWFLANSFPMIAAPVFNYLHHYRHMMERFGFTKIGEESDMDGNIVETIYGYDFTKERAHAHPDPIR